MHRTVYTGLHNGEQSDERTGKAQFLLTDFSNKTLKQSHNITGAVSTDVDNETIIVGGLLLYTVADAREGW